MPLTYDDIPGSWGTYSKGWPFIRCRTSEETDRAHVACSKENIVPYGSYVIVGRDIRVENEQLLAKLAKHLLETKDSYEDVMRKHGER